MKTASVLLGIIALLAAFFAASLQYPRFMTELFFGVNAAPVALNLKSSHSPREPDEKTKAIVAAAENFLASLDDAQKRAATYMFSDNAQRSNWSNFPEGMIPRGGLKLGEISKEQRALLDKLLSEIMSEKGVQNINFQLAAEDSIPSNSTLKYGTQHFYAAFLGKPSNTLPWMFQFGGHHLAVNVVIYGSDAVFSPMLTGGQPIHISHEGNDVFITHEEALAAQAFLDSLTEEQKKIAVRGEEAIDLQLGPGEYGKVVAPEGIKGGDLTDDQRALLLELIKTRLGFINEDDYAATMATVRAELDGTHFGWWGARDRPGFAYFRVTAPSLVLEYAPQDDGNADFVTHVHSMYRNPKNDYGAAWLE